MDKNYNVDDILSEIKQRKSQEKIGSRPAAKPGGEAPRVNLPDATASRPASPSRPEEFQFQFPTAQSAQGKPHAQPGGREEPVPPRSQTPERRANPMEFSGHVRPLTDKARMHPNRLNQPRQPQRQEPEGFRFRETPPGTGQIPDTRRPSVDFSAFRAPGLEEEPPHERTRVLPQFVTGQELRPEDIRQIDFSGLDNQAGDYYEEDYEDYEPAHSAIDFSEYNSKEDRRDVALDIARVKLWLFIRAGLTLLLTVIIFVLTFAGKYQKIPLPLFMAPEISVRMYILALTVLTGAVAVVCSSAMGGGIISLCKMRANSDSLAALAVLAAVAQGILAALQQDQVDVSEMNLYFAVASLAMLFNALGKMSMINRIQANFRIIASEREKKAVLPVESDPFCYEFIKDSARYRPTVAYAAKADFFTDFLSLSYSDKYDVGINRAVAPVCLGGALVVAVSAYFLTQNMLTAVSTFTAILCVCASLSATFLENIPLGKLTKRLAPQGGMVSGNKAVESFCDTKGLVLTDRDLFPDGHCTLHGIKIFSKSRIDEAILDAASVVCALDGALSKVFLEMIGGDRRLLRKVDNIVYEQDMGVSAWVNSHRVLIGNRQLMLNHGVSLPMDSFEQGTARLEGEPLYLSSSGEASARFLVSYRIDEELAEQLDLMAARETQLIVYTNDANITAHRLWELYGYPEDLIDIMPSRRQNEYKLMAAPRENAVAEIVYTGRASTMVKCIAACISARTSILTATMIQLFQIVLGYGLVAFIAFMGAITSLGIVQLCIYQVFWFVAISVVQKSRQS